MVSSTVYGTKDAPRGWFKNLNASMLEQGLTPVPHEAAAYSLICLLAHVAPMGG